MCQHHSTLVEQLVNRTIPLQMFLLSNAIIINMLCRLMKMTLLQKYKNHDYQLYSLFRSQMQQKHNTRTHMNTYKYKLLQFVFIVLLGSLFMGRPRGIKQIFPVESVRTCVGRFGYGPGSDGCRKANWGLYGFPNYFEQTCYTVKEILSSYVLAKRDDN